MEVVALIWLLAVRTAEPWSTGGVAAAFVLLFAAVLTLVWVLYVTGRR